MDELPKLRHVQAFPVDLDGEKYICLKDPEGVAEAVVLSLEAFFIISHFDGLHSTLEIQSDYVRQFGQLLFREKVEELAKKLDDAFFLDSERFRKRRKEFVEAYRALPVREAAHMGSGYPEDPQVLRPWLDAFYTSAEGPGRLPDTEAAGRNGFVRALVSPHVDFHRGGWCYAHAYRALSESPPAETYVVFGTAHQGTGDSPFALTRKDYRTPYGTMTVDREIVDAMEKNLPDPERYYDGEIAHKAEHSIEFQVVSLQHVLGARAESVRFVPILCGSFERYMLDCADPRKDDALERFLGALKEAVARLGRKVCYVAGADLSHVGPRYGDPEPVHPHMLKALAVADRRTVAEAAKPDAFSFYRSVEAEKDRRKICGLSSIYSLLRVAEPTSGKLLRYGQSLDEESKSVVTYAALVYY